MERVPLLLHSSRAALKLVGMGEKMDMEHGNGGLVTVAIVDGKKPSIDDTASSTESGRMELLRKALLYGPIALLY